MSGPSILLATMSRLRRLGWKLGTLLTLCAIIFFSIGSYSGRGGSKENDYFDLGTEKEEGRSPQLPMVYEYFWNSSRVLKGLETRADGFYLNNKKLKIISGSMHYFRIHPSLWRDRLKKLRSVGANTVETYVPWNLHEPRIGEFDFGSGAGDMSMFLDVKRYIEMAQQEDLLVLLRPGPYICSEWEFGGHPSWLQRDPSMKVRTNHRYYMDRVKIYLDKVLSMLKHLLFTEGGPIIGVQIENEYGSFDAISREYLEFLYQIHVDHGYDKRSLLFTSDGVMNGDRGTLLDKLFYTANFQGDVDAQFKELLKLQPGKPVMSMEFWDGWFDHWFEPHHTLNAEYFAETLEAIIGRRWNGSVNFYVFHGGTNFGFMAGANARDKPPYFNATVTSYDYDAPLSEAGDYTPKYFLAKELISKYSEPRIRRTEMPPDSKKVAYETTPMREYLSYDDIISQVPLSARFRMERPVPMENLPMNGDSGQSYGYIVYRKVANVSSGDRFEAGPVKDFGMLLIDSNLQPTGYKTGNYWMNSLRSYELRVKTSGSHKVDLFIENTGRVNFGMAEHFSQQKGLDKNGAYKLNGVDIEDVEIIALEFKSAWVKSLRNWTSVSVTNKATLQAPLLLQTTIDVDEPADTFLDMSEWHKGIVFVNGFNIGRYFRVGPQQTLYIPGPLLRKGKNSITIFEQFKPSTEIKFSDTPKLG